jgi:glycosyltransferase involved in cell wall biosynthesis
VFDCFERAAVRHSTVVIVICPELRRIVQELQPGAEPVLIENAPGAGDAAPGTSGPAVRTAFGVAPSAPLIVYTGTFEAYQGLDLLLAAAALVVQSRPDARFLLAGGRPEQVAGARAQAASAGLDGAVIFTGERPSTDIPAILAAADVLVSPRSRGTNTPLKIYQYLRSGRAIVATRLLTHTQVLDDTVAILTGTSPREFADGILGALSDPALAAAIGTRAAALAATKYSYDAYLERTREVVARVTKPVRPQVAGGVA